VIAVVVAVAAIALIWFVAVCVVVRLAVYSHGRECQACGAARDDAEPETIAAGWPL
jgi:hypothetical protein